MGKAVPGVGDFILFSLSGLGGGSASGKTTVATMIIEALDVPWVVLLSMDSFYKVLTKQQQEQAASNDFNFDHPDAFDFDLIIATLKKLKQGKSVKIPIYDFTTHSRKKEWKTLYGANVIIFEGIMAFADKELLKLLDLKIFVDTDSDIRLVRRLRRDISERGRDIEGVIKQYNKFVKPAFDQYIQPTMRLADIVVPRGTCPGLSSVAPLRPLRDPIPLPSALPRTQSGCPMPKQRSLQLRISKHCPKAQEKSVLFLQPVSCPTSSCSTAV
uniref:Uridine-cytidine kinase n=1 Tax=Malurus cyaneus samueli TaxID=2593467 RepID=A0A8C5TB64_9PASS